MRSDPWFCRPHVIRELGLRLHVASKMNRRAFWLICCTCRASVLCLRCTVDHWDLGHLLKAQSHAPSIARALAKLLHGFAAFRCPRGCNSALCDSPANPVLVAQAEEAAHVNIESNPR
jgi:hypothetical protein